MIKCSELCIRNELEETVMQTTNVHLGVEFNMTDWNDWDYLTCLACTDTDICSQILNTFVIDKSPILWHRIKHFALGGRLTFF